MAGEERQRQENREVDQVVPEVMTVTVMETENVERFQGKEEKVTVTEERR